VWDLFRDSLGLVSFLRLIWNDLARQRPLRQGELLHNGLVVAKPFRKQGIATSLLQSMADVCEQQHYQCLRLDAVASNQPALTLYRSAGYIAEQTVQRRAETYITLRRYL